MRLCLLSEGSLCRCCRAARQQTIVDQTIGKGAQPLTADLVETTRSGLLFFILVIISWPARMPILKSAASVPNAEGCKVLTTHGVHPPMVEAMLENTSKIVGVRDVLGRKRHRDDHRLGGRQVQLPTDRRA